MKKETTEEAAERLLAEGSKSKAVVVAVKTDAASVWLSKWERYRLLSELYYAYHAIHRYTEEPFTSLTPDALFHSAQFILHHVITRLSAWYQPLVHAVRAGQAE